MGKSGESRWLVQTVDLDYTNLTYHLERTMFVRDGGLMMTVQTLTLELSNLMAMPETVVIRKGMLALIAKEVRLAEQEIAEIRERYDVFSKDALLHAIQTGDVPEHPAWEDYIIWKNKEAHIAQLRQMAEKT